MHTVYTISQQEGTTVTLLIRNVCVEDIAEYTCVAENVRTKTHLELTAEKEEKVQVESSSPAEQVCRKGQDMNFKVNLAANQLKQPTVKWMFNGKEIKSSERVSREGLATNSIFFCFLLVTIDLSGGQINDPLLQKTLSFVPTSNSRLRPMNGFLS